MTVAEHDLIFAMTSHLPHLVSYALIDLNKNIKFRR